MDKSIHSDGKSAWKLVLRLDNLLLAAQTALCMLQISRLFSLFRFALLVALTFMYRRRAYMVLGVALAIVAFMGSLSVWSLMLRSLSDIERFSLPLNKISPADKEGSDMADDVSGDGGSRKHPHVCNKYKGIGGFNPSQNDLPADRARRRCHACQTPTG